MKKILAVLFLVYLTASAHALEIDPFKGPTPIAVVIQTDPWLMVIGSDTPMVVIYEDGQIIYQKLDKDNGFAYLTKKLVPEELAEVKKKLSAFGDYSKLKSVYDLAPNVFDLPETKIYLSYEKINFVTSVYGLMVPATRLPAYTVFGSKEKPDELPNAIKDLHAYLTSLDFADAKLWEPPYVEVMIWGYDYAPDESIHWPEDWPKLESPSTLKRRDAYSIFLPGKEITRLREFLNTQKEKGAVEIDGKKWAAGVRYTFPSEPIWFKAFRNEQEGEGLPNKAMDSDKK